MTQPISTGAWGGGEGGRCCAPCPRGVTLSRGGLCSSPLSSVSCLWVFARSSLERGLGTLPLPVFGTAVSDTGFACLPRTVSSAEGGHHACLVLRPVPPPTPAPGLQRVRVYRMPRARSPGLGFTTVQPEAGDPPPGWLRQLPGGCSVPAHSEGGPGGGPGVRAGSCPATPTPGGRSPERSATQERSGRGRGWSGGVARGAGSRGPASPSPLGPTHAWRGLAGPGRPGGRRWRSVPRLWGPGGEGDRAG